MGLKENVILGRLIPAGTGLEAIRATQVVDENMLEKHRQAEASTTLASHPPVEPRQQPEA